VLELTDHPLKDALAYLPQALMMLALYDGSQGYDAEDLDFSTFKTIQSVVSEAASGTLFPWGYGGHYRTFFGIHFEDAWMPSANLHVAGAPKIWLFIRKDDFRRLYTILSRTYVLSSLIYPDSFSQRSSHLVLLSIAPSLSIPGSSSETEFASPSRGRRQVT
jgi:JmjC domain, hydroxylase